MNRDKNARRALMVRRVRELGWPATQAAEAAGVSERTVRKWLARYRSEGGGRVARPLVGAAQSRREAFRARARVRR
jgi:transposase